MTVFHAKLTVLLAMAALALVACSGDDAAVGAPPCTPLEGAQGDPCEGDLTQIDDIYPGGNYPPFSRRHWVLA